jgi:hypothetical protein
MTEVYLWRLFCIAENKNTYVWAENKPTLCPNDHADRTINNNQTIIIKSIEQNKVSIEEQINGLYQATTLEYIIPTGSANSITNIDYILDFDMELREFSITADNSMLHDKLSLITNPDIVIGTLTNEVTSGTNVLNISPDTFTNYNLVKGMEISLNNVNVGCIVEIDQENFQIKLKNNILTNFPFDTSIQLNVYYLKKFAILLPNYEYNFGNKGLTGTKLNKGDVLRFIYHNKDGNQKMLCINMQ